MSYKYGQNLMLRNFKVVDSRLEHSGMTISPDVSFPRKRESNLICIFVVWILLMCFCTAQGLTEEKSEGPIYIVPVKGEIERGLTYFVRRSVKEAEKAGAKALIIHMDTNGGDFYATETIMEILLDSSVETYTFIDKKAFSAGAFIAVATKHIYMSQASVIGAATPIAVGPTGGPQEISGSVEEKITSGIRALMATAAEKNGHPRKIVEAMVDRDVEVKGIIEKGKLLTLTNKEAEKKKVGLSEGTLDNLNELIKKVGAGAVVRMEASWSEKISRMVTSSGVRAVLLMLGLLGIYVEVKTPGFGIGGTTALLCFSFFFFGHYIAGLAGWEELLLFTIGIILLSVEIFVLPGFGVAGLLGITLILGSLVLAMTGAGIEPGIPWWTQKQYEQALYSIAIAIVGSIGLAFLSLKFFLPKTPLWSKISLASAETKDKGFTTTSFEKFLDKKGMTQTVLRPSGKAVFGEEILDVVTEMEMISEGVAVKVVRVEGNRIVVAEDKNA